MSGEEESTSVGLVSVQENKALPQTASVLTSEGVLTPVKALVGQKVAIFGLNGKPAVTQARRVCETQGKVHLIITRKGHRALVPTNAAVLRFDGRSLQRTPTVKVCKDDFIVIPRWYPFERPPLNLIEPLKRLPNLRVTNISYYSAMIDALEKVKGTGTIRGLAQQLGTTPSNIRSYRVRRTFPPASFLASIAIPMTQFKKETASTPTFLPSLITPELAEFLGLLLSDGFLRKNQVVFCNNNPILQTRFTSLAKYLFGLDAVEIRQPTVLTSVLYSSVLWDYLVSMGVPQNKKSRTVQIPEELLRMGIEFLLPFLNGYIAGDGHISSNGVEIATSSEEMVKELGIVLLKLGLIHRFSSRVIKGHRRWRIFVEGQEKRKLAAYLGQATLYPKTFAIKQYAKVVKKRRYASDVIPIAPELLEVDPASINPDQRVNFFRARKDVRAGSNISPPRLDYFLQVISPTNPNYASLKVIRDHLTYFHFDRVEHNSPVEESQILSILDLKEPIFLIGEFNFLV